MALRFPGVDSADPRLPDVVLDASVPDVDVRRHGASPSATAAINQAAIQATINEAGGQRAVYLPPGVFTVGGTRVGTYNAILTYTSGLRFHGPGTLKIADNFTDGGDYRLFAPASAITTDNVTFEGFKVDGNAANNLVLGSSGGNIRQAYMIFCYAGENVTVDDVTFVDCPGRNIIVLGNNLTASITNGRVSNCRFRNMGGAITNNHLQNDHSTVYTQFNGGTVTNNTFANDSVVDPASPATRTVSAMEIHGSRTLVQGNRVTNYTHGGNAVAGVFDSIGNSWVDNKFAGLTKLGISLWTLSTFTHSDLTISRNVMQMHSDLNTVLAGVYQFPTTAGTTKQMRNLTITENTIYSDYSTPHSAAWHGIYLTAIDGAKVARNTIRNTSGDGIILDDHDGSALNIEHVDISDNTIINAGYHTVANRLWAILVINSDTADAKFHDIRIADNTITKATAAGPMRGISIQGAGTITDVTVVGLGKVSNIANLANIASNTGSDTALVSILPRVESIATATSPTSGVWRVGDQLLHDNVAASGTLGKVCTTAGGAVQAAVWAVATAYIVGQWVRTSGNKVLECIVGGTSHASTEPNPTVLGDPVTDNTVTWAYRATALAVFKTFGAVAA
jgi:hypothetical protein